MNLKKLLILIEKKNLKIEIQIWKTQKTSNRKKLNVQKNGSM